MSTTTEIEAVIEAWRDSYSPATAARMGELARRFARRLEAIGIDTLTAAGPVDCDGWINAPTRAGRPATATVYWRRTTVRAVFRQLRHQGVCDGDPTLDLALARRDHRYARPLTDDEIALCRAFAAGVTGPAVGRRAAAWALAETGATVGEIPRVTAGDLNDPRWPTAVALPGGRGVRARQVPLGEWPAKVIAGHLARHPHRSGDRLAYRGTTTTPGTTAGATRASQHIHTVLTNAGLSDLAYVRPSSVRHWAGRHAYDNGSTLADVARLLGLSSLDATAARIGLELPGGQGEGRLR